MSSYETLLLAQDERKRKMGPFTAASQRNRWDVRSDHHVDRTFPSGQRRTSRATVKQLRRDFAVPQTVDHLVREGALTGRITCSEFHEV